VFGNSSVRARQVVFAARVNAGTFKCCLVRVREGNVGLSEVPHQTLATNPERIRDAKILVYPGLPLSDTSH
jgi:hypothetical protein